MTLAQRYAESLWPDRVTILGRTMQAYCIGHALLLHRVGSPFLEPGLAQAAAPEGIGDLLLALWICSRPWDKALAGLHTRRLRWMLRCWAWQLRKFPGAPLAIVAAETQFTRYITQAWDGPSFWKKQTSAPSRPPGAPILACLKITVMAALHCSEREALSTPVRAAIFDCAAWSESQGTVEIVGEEELACIEEAQRRNATMN